MEKTLMSVLKVAALAAVLAVGATQISFAQTTDSSQSGASTAAGGGAGTASGHPQKAQNNDRGPGKSGPSQGNE
jgi:hypothetical protein